MNLETVFQLAGPDVVHDAIDDGIVIVNLAAGSYFTLDGTAREIWQLIEAGRPLAAINTELAQRFDGEPPQIADGTERFIDRLLEEGLIVAAAGPASPGQPVAAGAVERVPFVPPALIKYTDLEDLLTLDPIHEVGDSGWPHLKAPGDPA